MSLRVHNFFIIHESSLGNPQWEKAALTMDLNNAGAQVIEISEDPGGSFAEVTVKFRVPREYAENIETYSTQPIKRGRKRRV